MTWRDSTKGPLQVDSLQRRVWLWDGHEPHARPWHVIVRREVDTPTAIKYSLSNAPAATPPPGWRSCKGSAMGLSAPGSMANRTSGWGTTRCAVGGAGIIT